MTAHASFVENIQGKLPCAKLILQKKPGPLCDWQSCALTAVSLGNPSKTYSMTFDDGMGEVPPDDVVTSFVDNALRVLNG
jgi:hypothetical protein